MTVKIILEPLEPFFFGGERTFGTLGDERNGSYIAHSERFPTQTTLLGMLRKEVLTQAGFLTRKLRGEWVDGKKRASAIDLVGIGKPDIAGATIPDLGKIESIGPVHLYKERACWLPLAHTYDLNLSLQEGKPPLLEGFNPKDHHPFDWLFPLPQGDPVELDEVFRRVETIGNQKSGGDDAFFKKRAYRLADGYAFAFDVTLDFDLSPSIVSLGADGSRFAMRIEKEPEEPKVSSEPDRVYFLSDVLLSRPLGELCTFAITEERRIKSLTGKNSVRKKVRTDTPDDYRFKKSVTAYLYRQGSLVYQPKQALFDELEASPLRKIGYNHITPKESK